MKNERNHVVSSVGKRRRFSLAEKQQLVAATLKPGASVAAVAREAGIRATQLYGWRLRLRGSVPKGFAPVRIAPEVAASAGTLETASGSATCRCHRAKNRLAQSRS